MDGLLLQHMSFTVILSKMNKEGLLKELKQYKSYSTRLDDLSEYRFNKFNQTRDSIIDTFKSAIATSKFTAVPNSNILQWQNVVDCLLKSNEELLDVYTLDGPEPQNNNLQIMCVRNSQKVICIAEWVAPPAPPFSWLIDEKED